MLCVFVRELTDPDATPVFASADPAIVRGVAHLIARRVAGSKAVVLRRFDKRREDGKEEG